MSLIEIFVRNPVKVAVGVLLVRCSASLRCMRMPMQLTPEVQTPTLTVETSWPGASPQEVEQEIVIEQEEQLKSVEGVTKMTSREHGLAGQDHAGVPRRRPNMEEALLKVNSRLQQVPEYPEDADEPVISTANASDRPIAWFILSAAGTPRRKSSTTFASKHPELADELHERARCAQRRRWRCCGCGELAAEASGGRRSCCRPTDLDVNKLRRFAEDEIEARFERVPGVSQSNVFGGLEDELQVVVDPEKLAARRLTLTDVRNVLRGQNEDTSAGDFWEGKRRWVVRALGQFRTPEQVENQLLAIRDGAPVFVRDVGRSAAGLQEARRLRAPVRRVEHRDQLPSRETGANVLDVMDGLRRRQPSSTRRCSHRASLQLTQVYDETEYIYSAIDLVKDNIFVGGALTMAVLMLFLHLGVAHADRDSVHRGHRRRGVVRLAVVFVIAGL